MEHIMKHVLIIATLASTAAFPAIADSANWSSDKQFQMLVNRCSNAGKGNGSEDVIRGQCGNFKNDSYFSADAYATMDEDTSLDQYLDVDPGNSQENNANN